MIISASRRTDIPAFYSPWLWQRLREKQVLVPRPHRPAAWSMVSLSPDVVDCLVFFTKNALPMLNMLPRIRALGHACAFQYTITPYGKDVEPCVPPLAQRMDTFRRCADMLGPHCMVWRYDPILLDGAFSADFHAESFGRLAEALTPYAVRCVISIADVYAHAHRPRSTAPAKEVARTLGLLESTAKSLQLPMTTCAEDLPPELSGGYIERAGCLNVAELSRVAQCSLHLKMAKSQRPLCLCVESVDIGAYDSCVHGCAYCYAVTSFAKVCRVHGAHNPKASSLIGEPAPQGEIKEKYMVSCREQRQGSLWE